MAKYLIVTEWAGYSRGVATYEVEANSEEEARMDYWDDDNPCTKSVVRDDTEQEIQSIILLEDK